MSNTPSYPETAIETAGPYYQGWLTFTKFATFGICAIVALLVIMAATLV